MFFLQLILRLIAWVSRALSPSKMVLGETVCGLPGCGLPVDDSSRTCALCGELPRNDINSALTYYRYCSEEHFREDFGTHRVTVCERRQTARDIARLGSVFLRLMALYLAKLHWYELLDYEELADGTLKIVRRELQNANQRPFADGVPEEVRQAARSVNMSATVAVVGAPLLAYLAICKYPESIALQRQS